MTPEKAAVWMHTYQQVLGVTLHRTGSFEEAIKQAAESANKAAALYPCDEPTKRGPGRPPKEKSE